MTKRYSYGDLTPGSVTGGFALVLEITEISVNPGYNTSVLGFDLQLWAGQGSAYTGSLTCAVRIDGIPFDGTVQVQLEPGQNVSLLTGEVTVSHGTTGGRTVPVQAWNEEIPEALPVLRPSGIWRLSAIADACTLGATDAYIGGSAILAVTRNHAQYGYTLAYRFGGLQGYLDERGNHSDTPVLMQAQTLVFPIPDHFYEEIPDKKEGKCTLICTTFWEEIPVGEPQSTQFRVMADPEICKPQLTAGVSDANSLTAVLTGDPQVLVRYASTACCHPIAIAQKGASIAEVTVNGIPVENGQVLIPNVESPVMQIQARDSRGFTAELVMEVPWVSYVRLSCNAEAKRADPVSGKVQVTVTGLCYGGSFGAVNNTLQVTVTTPLGESVPLQTQVQDSTYVAVGEISGLDYTASHSLAITVADQVEVLNLQANVGRGVPVFDWGERDFRFHVPVFMPGINGADADFCLGSCQDADRCLHTGTYALTEESRNVPVTDGGLIVFCWGSGVLQMAVDPSGSGCYLRTAAQSMGPWRLCKWEDLIT